MADPGPLPSPFAVPDEGLRSPGDRQLVLPHYFSPFPLSLDNRPAEQDYYERQFLDPAGEGGKHREAGGYLRQRPLPRAPWADADPEAWRWRNLCEEVLTARACGADGFAFDILSTSRTPKQHRWKDLVLLLDAARTVAPGFRILLMPDMEAEFRLHPEHLVPAVLALADHPALLRLADGRLALSVYNAQRQPPEFYREALAALERAGVKVAFMPVFQAWWRYADAYAPLCHGVGDWGCGTLAEATADPNRTGSAANAHGRGLWWFAPVRPQDFRPKSKAVWEAANRRLFDAMWEDAVRGGAEWTQVITWNDYGEGSEIAPSTGTGLAVGMWNLWHAARYRTGAFPAPSRDAIAWCHRIHRTADAPVAYRIAGSPVDEAEVTAVLTAPAELVWTVGGEDRRSALPAGIHHLRTPLVPGAMAYRIEREGRTVLAAADPWPVQAAPARTDLLYRWGSTLEDEQRAWLAGIRARIAGLTPPTGLGASRDLRP